MAQLINKQIVNPDIVVKTNQQELKEIFAGLKNVASISLAMTDGSIDVKGGKVKVPTIFRLIYRLKWAECNHTS